MASTKIARAKKRMMDLIGYIVEKRLLCEKKEKRIEKDKTEQTKEWRRKRDRKRRRGQIALAFIGFSTSCQWSNITKPRSQLFVHCPSHWAVVLVNGQLRKYYHP